ncbi:MAG: BON domain-containing protein [Planctomycetes bacterium]|nr:BON domain-containing protein [Planctomycetota bacterium]
MSQVESPLSDRVLCALESNPHIRRRTLRIETSEGRVVLRGTVGSYFQKQMAQEALRQVDGIDAIENQLQVNWD